MKIWTHGFVALVCLASASCGSHPSDRSGVEDARSLTDAEILKDHVAGPAYDGPGAYKATKGNVVLLPDEEGSPFPDQISDKAPHLSKMDRRGFCSVFIAPERSAEVRQEFF